MAYKPFIKNQDGTMTEIPLYADKSKNDEDGNQITTTYLKKVDATTLLAGKADLTNSNQVITAKTISATNISVTTITAGTGNFTNINQSLLMKNAVDVYSASISGNNTYSGYALVTTRNKTADASGKIMIVDVFIHVNISSLVNQNTNQTCTISISGFNTSEYTNINAFLECSLTQSTAAVTNDYMNSHCAEAGSITRSSTGLTLTVSIRRAYSEGNVYGWLHTKVLLTKN